MNRQSLILAMLTAFVLCLYSCNRGPSKQYKAMEEEVLSIESQINTTSDCDDLQMLNFGILGLRSDYDNLVQSAAIPDDEISQLDEMLTRLEATWNGKWSTLEGDQALSDDEMDTSGEEDGDYPD